jgi:flagellar biogenesis protein FliO
MSTGEKGLVELIQPAAAIFLVLVLLGGALVALHKRGAVSFPGAAKNLEVIERVALGPQHALHLVRTGNRTLLIATGPQSCQVIEAGGNIQQS